MGYKFNPFTGNLDLIDTTAAAGADTQVQFNNGGNLSGSADLTWDDTGKELGVGGDINLDDGGTYATTLQLITPTANRTISFPDATGTVGLVGGSSGQLIYNNAGAYAGASSTSVGASGNITLSLAGAASTPPVSLTGTWFSGGTSTTTKPQLLIEPTGTTSTAWNTSGTGLGVNAASGFAGNLLDLQLNGSSKLYVNKDGNIAVSAGSQSAPSLTFTGDTNTGIYSPGADQLAISTSGQGRLFIDASGNVGINTSNPTSPLQVERSGSGSIASFRTKNVSDAGAIGIVNGTEAVGYLGDSAALGTGDTVNTSFGIRASQTRNLTFITGLTPTERVRITPDGKVGVGTTSPGGTLDVKAASSTAPLIVQGPSSEFARIDSSGRLLVGTSSVVGTTYAGSNKFQLHDDGVAGAQIFTHRSTGSDYPAILELARSRGSLASPTAVIADDKVGTCVFHGYDGANYIRTAAIDAAIDGTPGANDMPGRLVFSVTADGASSPTEALRISNDRSITVSDGGNIAVGTTTGTKIGTATSQKIGFFDTTPVVQPTTGVAEAAFVENSGGTAVNVDSTFGGYTLQQVVQALQNLGILA